MKFSTYAALVGSIQGAKVMTKDSNPISMLNLATTKVDGEPLALAQAESKLMAQDSPNHAYQYPVQEQNFNGILGMLGTPTSMTDALHMQMNQIHFNERVMRQIRAIVEDTPELIETLCAAEGEDCHCVKDDHSTDANIIYGAITDEGKIDYMLGFAQDLADPSGTTKCSSDVFGDPVPDMDKYCWCQTWESDHVEGGHHVEVPTENQNEHPANCPGYWSCDDIEMITNDVMAYYDTNNDEVISLEDDIDPEHF